MRYLQKNYDNVILLAEVLTGIHVALALLNQLDCGLALKIDYQFPKSNDLFEEKLHGSR